ncbi:hypothetical protein ASD97_26075 [Streptomyces sp. Root63]|nr:hypothetical protein ASD97_26075 [Streptomyces sp. Root63]
MILHLPSVGGELGPQSCKLVSMPVHLPTKVSKTSGTSLGESPSDILTHLLVSTAVGRGLFTSSPLSCYLPVPHELDVRPLCGFPPTSLIRTSLPLSTLTITKETEAFLLSSSP